MPWRRKKRKKATPPTPTPAIEPAKLSGQDDPTAEPQGGAKSAEPGSGSDPAKPAQTASSAAPTPKVATPKRFDLGDGVVVEDGPMGRTIVMSGDPARKGIDIRPDAPGWGRR
jgi:hypothetical protein